MSVAKESSAPAEVKKADDSTEVNPIGKVLATKRLFGRRIGSYKATSKRMVEGIHKLYIKLSESEDDTAKAEIKVSIAKKCYALFRNYIISFNALTMGKEDDKRVVPTSIVKDLKSALTDSVYDKFEKVLKIEKEELEKELPKELDPKVVEALKKYVEDHEKDHFIDKYEETLAELEKEIDSRKDEIKARRVPKSPKSSSSRDGKEAGSAEDLLQDCLKSVQKRVRGLKFTKNDYEYYSDSQSQLDSLLGEVTREIFRLKSSLKSRFAKVQKKSSPPRGRRRGRSSSIFANDQIHKGGSA